MAEASAAPSVDELSATAEYLVTFAVAIFGAIGDLLQHSDRDDYVLYLVEALHSQERARELLQSIRGENTGVYRIHTVYMYL